MMYKYLLIRNIYIVFCIILLLSCIDNNSEAVVIPFSLENDRIVLNAYIHGQKGRFIFDSGIMHSNIGINARGLFPIAYTKRIYNGKLSTVLVYSLNRIRFGDTDVKARSWLINHCDSIKYIKEDEGYDGILGMRTFEGYWCELSFSKNEIILYKEKPEKVISHTPWKTLSKYDSFYLPIVIDNKEFFMNIDTGLQYGFLFPNDIINYKKDAELRTIISNEEVKKYYLVKTNSIFVLDEIYNDMLIMTNSYSAQRRNFVSHNDIGLIGIDFLKHYDFLFDYRDLRKGKTTGMYYQSNTPLSERDYGFFSFLKKVPEPGIISFYLSEAGLEITSILEDSISYNLYGLRLGTVITKINGQPIINFSKEEIVNPLFYHTITDFSILEDGNEKTIYLRDL